MCSKFNILLGLERCNESYISEESQSSKCIHEGEIVHNSFSKPK